MGLALFAKGVIFKRNDLGRRGPGGARLTSSPPYRGAPTPPIRQRFVRLVAKVDLQGVYDMYHWYDMYHKNKMSIVK